MPFITKEDVAAVRNTQGKKISLKPFIGIEKDILVCEVSLNAGLKMQGAGALPQEEKTNFVLDAVSNTVFDVDGNRLTRADLDQLFDMVTISKGTELLNLIQAAAFNSEGPAGK